MLPGGDRLQIHSNEAVGVVTRLLDLLDPMLGFLEVAGLDEAIEFYGNATRYCFLEPFDDW